MAKVQVSLPQGTRDFNAATVRKRQYIIQTIREIFERYGFQPLETPAMENLETLMGKYGEEGDKLIFKILNNGLNDPKNIEKAKEGFDQVLQGKNDVRLTERALKYDLTIPFARYVAMNHHQLTFPFKRYQVQPVWRADRPQKGRYREFYQCDCDVVGSQSLLNEVELAAIYNDAFQQLGLHDYELHINSRKILGALAELCGGLDKLTEITIAIDKLDKIGLEKVKEELTERGLQAAQIDIISNYLSINGSNKDKMIQIESLLGHTTSGAQGIAELQYLLTSPIHANNDRIAVDFTLARGLNYYTGMIFEIKAPERVKIGSIGGGGRYDDLTSLFGVSGIPGVGISFGLDRIYDVLEELSLFPEAITTGTQILFFNNGTEEAAESLALLQRLRSQGVRGELYHEAAKFDKQFKYAEKKQIPFIAIIGSRELENGTVVLKNLNSGTQQELRNSDIQSSTLKV